MERSLKVKREVGSDRKTINFTNPCRMHPAHDVPRESGEYVAIGQYDHSRLEGGQNLIKKTVGEIGRVQQAEGGGGEAFLLFAFLRGFFHHFGTVPLRHEDRETLGL